VNNIHGNFCVGICFSNQKIYDSIAELAACVFYGTFYSHVALFPKDYSNNIMYAVAIVQIQ